MHRRFAILAILISVLSLSVNSAPAQQVKKKTYPEPQWLDPNQSDANGAKYQKFASSAAGSDVSYHIWLPPQYDKQTSDRFPVIYWLHGLCGNQRGGTQSFGTQVDDAIREGKLPPTIVVFVNGMVSSFYCDWANGKRPIETVIIKELIPHIDQTYRTVAKREGRVIQGYSMGGFGAGHLGFKYPELFGTVVIDAGALIGEMALNGPNISFIFEGGFDKNLEKFMAEHPATLATKNADKIRGQQKVRIGCGGDDSLLPRNRELHELLTTLNIKHEFEIVEGVAHNAGDYYRKLAASGFKLHKDAFEALTKDN